MSTETVINSLTSFWLGTRDTNLARLETYYDGTQTPAMNGMFTPEQLNRADVKRFFKPINYLAAVVDEPVGYLALGRIRITAGENEALEAWAADYYRRRIQPRLDDTVRWQALYGEAYLYLWTDREGSSRGLKVDALAPIEGGKMRVLADYGGQDSEELTAAVLYKTVPVDMQGGLDEYRITVTADRVVVEKRRVSESGLKISNEKWEPVSDEVNPSGVLPVVPVFNPVPSDVLNMIPVQDDLDKLHADLRMSREYAGYPLVTTDAMDVKGLEVGPGRILFGGTFTIHPPPAITAFLDERQSLLESAAKITKSLTLLTEAGGTQSGVALQYRQQAFLERLQGKAQRLGTAMELTLRAAARILSYDAELYAIETAHSVLRPTQAELRTAEFGIALEPLIPTDQEGDARIANIWLNQLGMSRETAFGKAGIEDPLEEIERADREMTAQRTPPPVIPGELEDADDGQGS